MVKQLYSELEIKGNEKSDDDLHTLMDDEDYQEASGDSNTESESVSIVFHKLNVKETKTQTFFYYRTLTTI